MQGIFLYFKNMRFFLKNTLQINLLICEMSDSVLTSIIVVIFVKSSVTIWLLIKCMFFPFQWFFWSLLVNAEKHDVDFQKCQSPTSTRTRLSVFSPRGVYWTDVVGSNRRLKQSSAYISNRCYSRNKRFRPNCLVSSSCERRTCTAFWGDLNAWKQHICGHVNKSGDLIYTFTLLGMHFRPGALWDLFEKFCSCYFAFKLMVF